MCEITCTFGCLASSRLQSSEIFEDNRFRENFPLKCTRSNVGKKQRFYIFIKTNHYDIIESKFINDYEVANIIISAFIFIFQPFTDRDTFSKWIYKQKFVEVQDINFRFKF